MRCEINKFFWTAPKGLPRPEEGTIMNLSVSKGAASLLGAICLIISMKGIAMSENTNPEVLLKTSMGEIVIELYEDKSPVTVKNFLRYVREGRYDGTIFHRVIDGFMIQGGGMTPDMKEQQTHAPIKNEAGNGMKNKKGTVAMARTQVVDSATAQFFINLKDNDFLDHRDDSPRGYGYAVFGKVVKGMDVVEKIGHVKTGSRGFHRDVPLKPVVIEKAAVLTDKKVSAEDAGSVQK